MKIGFIGLGRMGRGMALNLVKAGHDVTVFDLHSPAREVLDKAGATVADSSSAVVGATEVIFLSLPGPKEIEAAIFGDNGILEAVTEGKTLFDLSTNSREMVLRMHEAFAAKGANVLDAPVSGGPAGAASGDLAIWVGGDEEVFERYEPVLRAFADKPRLCGPIGSGTIVKLVNNLTGHLFLSAMSETFSMAVKAGVDALELWDALRLGVIGKAPAINMLTGHFLPGKFDPPSFALNLAFKDVNLAAQLGRDLDVPMRLSALVAADMTEAMSAGQGALDCRIYLVRQLDRAGVSIVVDPDELAERMGRAVS